MVAGVPEIVIGIGGFISTQNIVRKLPTQHALYVTFACKNGEERTYRYGLHEGAQILAGADPANFSGELTSMTEPMMDIAEGAAELLE